MKINVLILVDKFFGLKQEKYKTLIAFNSVHQPASNIFVMANTGLGIQSNLLIYDNIYKNEKNS